MVKHYGELLAAVDDHTLRDPHVQFIRDLYQSSLEGPLRHGSAQALVQLVDETERTALLDAIFQTMIHPEYQEHEVWIDGQTRKRHMPDLTAYAPGLSLAEKLPPELIVSQLGRVLEQVHDQVIAYNIVKTLLKMVFDASIPKRLGLSENFAGSSDERLRVFYQNRRYDPENQQWIEMVVPFPVADPLNPIQIQVGLAIARSETYWKIDTNLTAVFGLPLTRSELETLLSLR
jgi:hypothetical protein